jgi:hypothetical protein
MLFSATYDSHKINESDTKYMIMSTSESRRKTQDLKVEGKSFMGVSNFKYLGNMLSNDNRNDTSWKQGLFCKPQTA